MALAKTTRINALINLSTVLETQELALMDLACLKTLLVPIKQAAKIQRLSDALMVSALTNIMQAAKLLSAREPLQLNVLMVYALIVSPTALTKSYLLLTPIATNLTEERFPVLTELVQYPLNSANQYSTASQAISAVLTEPAESASKVVRRRTLALLQGLIAAITGVAY